MGLKTYLRKALKSALKSYDYELIESRRLYEWQKEAEAQPSYKQSPLPPDAAEYLRPNHPRLQALQNRYAVFNNKVTTPLVWNDALVTPEDILYFRGDNAYVWQLRGPNMNLLSYALTAFYVKSIDKLGLLERLEEDDLFGNFTFHIDNRVISRDLLDSITEIHFLEKHLNLSLSNDRTILDIGAGYGRLANRMVRALPNVQNYLCTDAVAVSSFISEYYLRFRGIEGRARVVPLDEIDRTLADRSVDIAVNIHSFSECTISAIDWWVSLLAAHRIKHLMVVPNAGAHGGELLLTNDGKDFGQVIARHGYQLVVKEPKYSDPAVQKYAINPTYHYLFELQ